MKWRERSNGWSEAKLARKIFMDVTEECGIFCGTLSLYSIRAAQKTGFKTRDEAKSWCIETARNILTEALAELEEE